MSEPIALVWFRRDLRTADNPALSAAMASRRPVAGLYVLDETRRFAAGGAQKWFLHHALAALRRRLEAIGVPLLLRAGPEFETLEAVVRDLGVGAVYWNRRYITEDIATDTAVRAHLHHAGVTAASFNASLLREPWEVRTKSGGPFRVFTPFWKALSAIGPDRTAAIPAPSVRAPNSARRIISDETDSLRLLPTSPNWASAFGDEWTPNEDGARQALDIFLSRPVDAYDVERDRPGTRGTSRLSPHLAIGTIGPHQVWRAAQAAIAARTPAESGGAKFLAELAWREFAAHLLYYNPSMTTAPLRADFNAFPWRDDAAAFRAWTRGMTGVPIIDAGMRELWRTGWMHNRIRMIAASFLVKNLLVPWEKGERWFWDTLVDADGASNAAGWQWVAGCGADAAPYFRIFNPVTQGEKFDPSGAYVRKFVPEIAGLPDKLIHAPWRAPELAASLGYPPPIVDPAQSAKRALAAFAAMKSAVSDLELTA
ncbi:MAG: deoxyribodipyrimidine photolyase [Alphaproteobacteria bacterium RIFCSPHIGHO2_12_FULL_63_12]|nr:MAG: deoxyribodipyrimidine photolyase [Alphaproteobacteria bacterium RIFCSPHIGHO2_12_FULL_63_12]